jgi:hypothetical protein
MPDATLDDCPHGPWPALECRRCGRGAAVARRCSYIFGAVLLFVIFGLNLLAFFWIAFGIWQGVHREVGP